MILKKSMAMTESICDLTEAVHVAPENGDGEESNVVDEARGGGRHRIASISIGNMFFSQKYAKTVTQTE